MTTGSDARGGLTTKLHLAVEQGQKPMSIMITAGQRGGSPPFEPVLKKIRVRRMGPCRACTGPNRAVATRYDKLAVRYEATVLVAAIDEWL